MAWFKIDDGWWAHPKTLRLSPRAIALWAKAGAWSAQQLTDGRVPSWVIATLGANKKDAGELVAVGYWVVSGDGWDFHDWAEYQPSREEVEAKRAARSEAGRKGGERSAASRRAQAIANREASKAEANASPVASSLLHTNRSKTEPRPDPTRTRPVDESPDGASSTTSTAARGDLDRSFETAYAAWPKKTERKTARARWAAAAKRHPGGVDGLVDDVQRFAAAYEAAGIERQFVPALAVWLGRERWTDELPMASTPTRPRGLPSTGELMAETDRAYEELMANMNGREEVAW